MIPGILAPNVCVTCEEPALVESGGVVCTLDQGEVTSIRTVVYPGGCRERKTKSLVF